MSVFAVLSLFPPLDKPQPTFVVVDADDAQQAMTGAAHALIEAGHADVPLVAVFSRSDLEKVIRDMSPAPMEGAAG